MLSNLEIISLRAGSPLSHKRKRSSDPTEGDNIMDL